METMRFEFIPCNCGDSKHGKHGHIYDNVKNENSILHIHNVDEGVKFMNSFLTSEITEKNINAVTFSMCDFFSLVTETEADGTCYQVAGKNL